MKTNPNIKEEKEAGARERRRDAEAEAEAEEEGEGEGGERFETEAGLRGRLACGESFRVISSDGRDDVEGSSAKKSDGCGGE
ncbi:hypothetical protein Droror1_Dr00015754 [Drosera rotundifolia]